jgi:hypothetical protein
LGGILGTSYRIDEQQKCIFVSLYGDMDEWDLGAGAQKLLADPRFKPDFARLVDASDLNIVAIQPTFMKAIAEDFRTQTTARLALVSASHPAYQLLKLYRDALKGVDCRVFRDRNAALKWLGVSEAVI